MDTDIALARLASGRTVPIGAECGCGVHDGPPGVVWKQAKRSIFGPPFSLQVSCTTVKCRATIHQAMRNKLRLERRVNEIPELKTYLEEVGRVAITREYLPRLNRARAGIYLTSEGLIFRRVGKGGNESPLSVDAIYGEAGKNGAIDKLGSMSSIQLLQRVADRIDPATNKK
jgi:hypothetical protein